MDESKDKGEAEGKSWAKVRVRVMARVGNYGFLFSTR